MANFTIEPRKILRKLPKRQMRYQKKGQIHEQLWAGGGGNGRWDGWRAGGRVAW